MNLKTWKEVKTPDRSYGMSYPYCKVYLDDVVILCKFPFSPYIGNINKFSIILADITSYKTKNYNNGGKEFSVQIYNDNQQVNFKRNFDSMQSAYLWAVNECNIPTV